MQYPGHCEETKQVDRHELCWVNQRVQESYQQEWWNVLQVIQVAPANKFNTADATIQHDVLLGILTSKLGCVQGSIHGPQTG